MLIEAGHLTALIQKLKGLVDWSPVGYVKSPAAARELIENLLKSENSVLHVNGKHLKAFALKYGVPELGYGQDKEEAIEFIRQNYVPY